MEVVTKKASLNRGLLLGLFSWAILFCVFSGPVLAQSTASLNGTVSDPAGAVLPNAKVTAVNQATGVESATQTDGAGAYLFPSLPIGTYRIVVTAPSFKSKEISDLKLEVATAVTQNVQLEIGEASEKVVIIAESVLVDTATTGLGQVINDKTVQESAQRPPLYRPQPAHSRDDYSTGQWFSFRSSAWPGIVRNQYRRSA